MRSYITIIFLCTVSILISQDTEKKKSPDPALSVTTHQVEIDGEVIDYTATAGYYLMRDEDGYDQAKVFFIAYSKNGVSDYSSRPLTFSFNGGPGSSSVWLHMGALGPRRILMTPEGGSIPPPFKVVDNEYSWLDKTDLVFIDPMMTGFTRPAEGEKKEDFTGFTNDLKLVGDFIYQYLGMANRWSSPKYICGESYGTTRAAGLSGYLQSRHRLNVNGLMLVSAIMNFQTARESRGNDLPFALYLPTYAATAWYHGKVDKTRYTDLEPFLEEVESFALNEYTLALTKGDQLTSEEKKELGKRLSAYTGLKESYLEDCHYRTFTGKFNKELLREEGKIVGRLDSRFIGYDYDDAGERYSYDPSMEVISGPYTTGINHYLREDLNVDIPITYEILTGRVRPWDYSNVENTYLNVAETLREAMTENPFLNVWISNGYYDMATGYFATQYTIDHMFLRPHLKENIWQTYYEAGHMMYIHDESLKQFKEDFVQFIEGK